MQINLLSLTKLRKWVKKFAFILANYEANNSQMLAHIKALEDSVTALNRRLDYLDKLVRERTDIAVDVNFKEPNYVIVVGRYRKVDYIQTYSLDNADFTQLIDHLQRIEKHGQLRRLDAPPQILAVFKRNVLDF